MIEKELIKRNIIIYGLVEDERSYQVLENTIINLMKKIFEFSEDHIDFVYRLGRRREGNRAIKIDRG